MLQPTHPTLLKDNKLFVMGQHETMGLYALTTIYQRLHIKILPTPETFSRIWRARAMR